MYVSITDTLHGYLLYVLNKLYTINRILFLVLFVYITLLYLTQNYGLEKLNINIINNKLLFTLSDYY